MVHIPDADALLELVDIRIAEEVELFQRIGGQVGQLLGYTQEERVRFVYFFKNQAGIGLDALIGEIYLAVLLKLQPDMLEVGIQQGQEQGQVLAVKLHVEIGQRVGGRASGRDFHQGIAGKGVLLRDQQKIVRYLTGELEHYSSFQGVSGSTRLQLRNQTALLRGKHNRLAVGVPEVVAGP